MIINVTQKDILQSYREWDKNPIRVALERETGLTWEVGVKRARHSMPPCYRNSWSPYMELPSILWPILSRVKRVGTLEPFSFSLPHFAYDPEKGDQNETSGAGTVGLAQIRRGL